MNLLKSPRLVSSTLLLLLAVIPLLLGWTVRDPNRADIYTGANATPSISAASDGTVTLGPVGFTGTHNITGKTQSTELRIKETGGSDYVAITAPSLTAPYTLTLPADGGASGQLLRTDGSGGLSWISPSVNVPAAGAVYSDGVDLLSEAQLALARGGTAKNLTAVNGGVVWTDTDSQEVTAAGTSGQYFKSNGAAAPSWSAIDLSGSSVTGTLGTTNGGTGVSGSATFPSSGTIATNTNTLTFSNKTIAAGSNTITGLTDTNVDAAAALDATKLGSGSVSNTELGYLDGVTSAIQTQLNAKLDLAGGTMTGTLTLAGDAVSSLEPITKQQLDAGLNGLSWKRTVRVATTAAGTLASSFENGDVVDSVTLDTADRILIKDQASTSERGVYVVNASGAPTRATDADTFGELNGAAVIALEGTDNANKGFYQIAELTSFSSQSWIQNFGTGLYVGDGLGIELSGSTFQLELDGSTLSKSATGLKVADLGIANAQIGTSAAIARSKLAVGTASHVLINDGSGVMSSEAALALSRGGTGTSLSSGSTGQVLQASGSGVAWADVAVPTGAVMPFLGSVAPTGWFIMDGTPISRTTYSVLFAMLGTTYGVGDGSTTFNLPIMAGRYPIGINSGDATADVLGETGGTASSAHSHVAVTWPTYSVNSHTHPIGTIVASSVPAHTHGVGSLTSSSAGSHSHPGVNWNIAWSHTAGTAGTPRFYRGSNSTDSSTVPNGTVDVGSSGAHTHTFSGTVGTGANGDAPLPITMSGSAGGATATTTPSGGSIGAANATENRAPFLVVTYIIKS